MDTNIDFIVAYANITIAYVAFMAIIATLCNSFGERLSDLQYLLVRFFVEVGLIHLMQSLIIIALFYVLENKSLVWAIGTYCALLTVAGYLPYYIARRIRIRATIPAGSKFVICGYAIIICLLTITALEIWWAPSLLTVSLYFLWVTLGNFLVFIIFLGSFLQLGDTTSESVDQHDKRENLDSEEPNGRAQTLKEMLTPQQPNSDADYRPLFSLTQQSLQRSGLPDIN